MSDKTVIEINGVKMEVDLRHAKRIDELRVGDRVKVLIKGFSDYTVNPGVIIGFENFKNLPTILVCYAEFGYNSAEIKFVSFNEQSKDIEIVRSIDDDHAALKKSTVVDYLDREVKKKQMEIEDIEAKKKYFLENFKVYWSQIEVATEA